MVNNELRDETNLFRVACHYYLVTLNTLNTGGRESPYRETLYTPTHVLVIASIRFPLSYACTPVMIIYKDGFLPARCGNTWLSPSRPSDSALTWPLPASEAEAPCPSAAGLVASSLAADFSWPLICCRTRSS